MEDGKSTILTLLNRLMTRGSDDQRSDHLNIIKYFLLNSANIKEIVSKINKSLAVASTRDESFELIDEIIEFLPVDLVNENAITWITFALGQRPKDGVKPLRLKIVGHLIDLCSDIPDFKKIVVADYLPEIIHASLKADNAGLTCLTTCMLRFSSSCLPQKNKIETALTEYLEYKGDDLDVIKRAAIAFHYLNQIGGAGADGINHQNNWTNQIEKLCSTIQELLTQLNEEDSVVDVATIAKKLRNRIVFLKIMLEKSYPVPKNVPLETMLNTISNGVDNHQCISGVLLTKAQSHAVIARVQVDFLYLLRSLIACTQQKLIPFSLTISKMLLNYLRRIHSCDCFKSSSVYSVACYTVTSFWLKTIRNSFHCSFHDKLIRFILDDIAPVEQKLTLQLNSNKNKKKNSSTKVSAVAFESKNECGVQNIKETVCFQALESLELFLNTVYLKINPKLTKELYTVLTKTLINIQGGKVPIPYTNSKCQLFLYRAIISLFEQPFLSIPPPLSFVIHLLNVGQNSKNIKISTTCQNGLSKLELLCQPVCPTLYVGREKTTENTEEEIKPISIDTEENVQSISQPISIEQSEIEKEAEKIRILSDIVIKPTQNGIEDVHGEQPIHANLNDSVNSEVEEIVNEETIADDSDVFVIESAEETMEESIINILNGEKDDDDVIEIFDEPPEKRLKTDDDDNSGDSMLSSFVNIVNDY